MEQLKLTQEWDKTFPKSDKVEHRKVAFCNRYGITLAADLYMPKDAEGKLPAIAVSGPFGAVKEQASGLYAQTMAERGFLAMAFDPSFTGESGGVDLPALETAFVPRCYVLQLRDDTRPTEDIWARAGEDRLRGLFLGEMRRRYDDAAGDEEERRKIALAVRFGLAALDGRDI